MLKVEDIERIRGAYYVETKRIRVIAREQGHHRRVVREAVAGRPGTAPLPPPEDAFAHDGRAGGAPH